MSKLTPSVPQVCLEVLQAQNLNQSNLSKELLFLEIDLDFESELFNYEWYYINNATRINSG